MGKTREELRAEARVIFDKLTAENSPVLAFAEAPHPADARAPVDTRTQEERLASEADTFESGLPKAVERLGRIAKNISGR